MTRASRLLRATQLQAVLFLAQGGTLRLCAGARQPTEQAPADDMTLAMLGLAGATASVDAETATATLRGASGRASRPGIVTWFAVADRENRPLLTGSVGKQAGDLQLTRVDLLPGDQVTIEALVLTVAEEPAGE